MLSKKQLFSYKNVKKLLKRYEATSAIPINTNSSVQPYEAIPRPKGLPLIGNLAEFLKKANSEDAVNYHIKLRRELGEIYRFKIPGKQKDFVFVHDPEDGRTLLSSDGPMPFSPFFDSFNVFRTGSLKHKFKTPGLVSQGEEWYEFRRAVQQDMMRPKSALFYVNDLENLVGEVIEKVESLRDSEGVVNSGLTGVLKQYALESMAVMFLGSKLGVLKGTPKSKKLIENVDTLFSYALLVGGLPVPILKMTGIYKKVENCTETIFDLCEAEVSKTKKRMETDDSLRETVLGKMILRNGMDSPIPVIMAIDSLGAGIDTTGYAAAFLLHHLATNPEKQEILAQEVLRSAGPNEKLTQETVQSMKYLKACITESMRLEPIAFATVRKTRVDMVLKGFNIPTGTMVGRVNSNAEKHYKQPEKFLPERWIRDSPQHSKADPFTSLPFGHGPRACIGQRFARLELYILAAKLVQKHRMEYVGGPLTTSTKSGFNAPAGEIKIKFTPRN